MSTTEFFVRTRDLTIKKKVAIIWFFLFTINSLCTTIIASLINTTWSTLDKQGQFIIVISILMNWTGTIMAFLSKESGKIEQLDDNKPKEVK